MDTSIDTDTLLALVSSLLTGQQPDTDTILEALVRCDGDVEATAGFLNQATRPIKKRTRGNLDDWLPPKSSKQTKLQPYAKTTTRTPDLNTNNSSSSTVHVRPVTDLMSLLRQPPSPKKAPTQLPPLLLSSSELVAQNTPCTLHLSVLPPELACRLFYSMVRASRGWQRNKWWLFDRLVESPHRTSFFARKDDNLDEESWREAAQYWYNGRMTEPPEVFHPAMEEACKIVEDIVNEQLKNRPRFQLEWDYGEGHAGWRANVAASNCYEGSKESVGFHSDQLTYLGPYPTIASLSLGTQRVFSLREVIPTDQLHHRKARTFNIPLPHNSLIIMHASCQERFKHSVPPQPTIDMYHPIFPETPEMQIEPSTRRINITFRFYRPDFRPPSIPRCKCGVPTVLRADMKNHSDGKADRYWWACYAGAQNEGKGCNYWKPMDMEAEGRGRKTSSY